MTTQKKHPALGVALAGIIAALYVALTWIMRAFNLDSGMIQVRVSEAFCVLTFFTPWAIPGMTIGCFIANFSLGNAPLDVLFGTLATLLGAVGGWLLRKVSAWLVPLPTVLANAIIIPYVIKYAYVGNEETPILFLMLTVGIGELIAAYILGMVLYFALRPYQKRLFGRFQ